MIVLLDNLNTISQYDWMTLAKPIRGSHSNNAKDGQSIQGNILNERLKANIPYTLAKIKGFQYQSCGYLDYILDKNTKGKYIVGLKTKCGVNTHCVSIDCDNRLIYDCMENHVLVLHRKTLDHCVGDDQLGVGSISHCLKIIQRPQKSKDNNMKRKASEISSHK